MIELKNDSTDIIDKSLVFDLDGIGRRIRAARGRYNLSQSEFAGGLHISRKWLSELENEKKCPSGLFLLGIECRYAINRDWILAGKGSMLVGSEWEEGGKKSAEAVMLLKSFSKLSKNGREKILNILNAFLFIEENKEKSPELDS